MKEQEIKINAELILELISKQDWINRVPRQLPEKRYYGEDFLWIDSLGNKLVNGGDFEAARELGSYPVRVYRFQLAKEALTNQTNKP